MSDDVTASFNLSVESNAADVARDGADGLANLQEKIAGSVEELRNLNAAFRSLKGGAGVSSAALDELKGRIGAHKATLAAQQQAYLKSGGTFKEVAERQRKIADREKATLAAKADAEKKAAKAKTASDKESIALGVAMGNIYTAAAAKALQLASAVKVAAMGLVAFGLAAADSRRSELLQLEGLTKMRYGLWWLGAGYKLAADKASFLQEQIDNVSSNSALGRDKVAGYADQLYRTGLRAGNLQAALEAMTITGATQGEGQAQLFAGMAAGARMAGYSVKKLSDDVKARLGGIAEAQTLGLTVQMQKLHESFNKLFSGLRIEPFLRGLKTVTDLFKLNTAEGRAMKALLEDIFAPLIDGAPTAGFIVKRVFQGLIIGALELDNAFLDLQISYYKIFGPDKPIKNAELMRTIVYGMAGAVAAVAVWSTIAAAGIAALFVVPIALGALAGAAVGALQNKFESLSKAAQGLGKGFITGIISGLLSGIPELVAAVFTAGGAMIKAFRDRMQIHSPSRVAFRDTEFVTAGQVNALKAGKPKIEAAYDENVTAPMRPKSGIVGTPAPASSGAARGQSITLNFMPGAIPVHGDAKETDIKESVRRAWTELLAGQVILAGGAAA